MATVKTVKVSNGELKCSVFGSGDRTMVILPGMSVAPVYPVADNVEKRYHLFCKEFTVYLFDYREYMPDGFTVEDMANDVLEAFSKLGIKEAYILGCSLGGMVGLLLAAEHKEVVKKLGLAATLCKPNKVSDETFKTWYDLSSAGDVVALNRDISSRVYSKEYFLKFESQFKATEKCGTPEQIARFRIFNQAALKYNSSDKISAITCPVVIYGAKGDKALSFEASLEIQKILGCELVEFSLGGHAIYDETDELLEKLLVFFG